jgi:hypothetical protein
VDLYRFRGGRCRYDDRAVTVVWDPVMVNMRLGSA